MCDVKKKGACSCGGVISSVRSRLGELSSLLSTSELPLEPGQEKVEWQARDDSYEELSTNVSLVVVERHEEDLWARLLVSCVGSLACLETIAL